MNVDETWASLRHPDFEGIEISDLGNIKNKYGKVTCGGKHANYLRVQVGDKKYLMHQLVCRVYHGLRPSDAHTVDHRNRNTTDNRADNLRWATAQQQRSNQDRMNFE